MKFIGIGAIAAGVLLLAGDVFDFHLHPIFDRYDWLGWIPIGLGALLLVVSEKGQGAA